MDLAALSESRIAMVGTDATTGAVATATYRLLARGRAVEPRQIGAFAGVSLARVETVLADWGGTRRDDQGRVVAFGGLELEPTSHALTVGGTRLFTWCAWDTLFIPLILGAEAGVESRTPDGHTVSLTVGSEGVRDVRPETAVLSLVQPPEAGSSEIRDRFCRHVLLFRDEEAGRRWVGSREDVTLVSVEEGARLGRRQAEAVTAELPSRRATPVLQMTVRHDPESGFPLPPDAEGEPVGLGSGHVTGAVEGDLRWALAERVGDGLCAMNLFAVIDTDDGARVDLEGQGFARLADPTAQRWEVAGALHLSSGDHRYSWLADDLLVWQGEADLAAGTATWHGRF